MNCTRELVCLLFFSQVVNTLPYPQTFLNRVLSKHPEFLHHSSSVDAILRASQDDTHGRELRATESADGELQHDSLSVNRDVNQGNRT